MTRLRLTTCLLAFNLALLQGQASAAPASSTVKAAASGGVLDDMVQALTREYEGDTGWESWVFQADAFAAGYNGNGLGGANATVGRMIGERQWLGVHAGFARGSGELGWLTLGVSWRQALSAQTWWGANVFYDFLSTEQGSDYGQFGVGLEYGWRRWTLRGNAYLPTNASLNKGDDPDGVTGVSGVWRGLDAEVQYALFSQPRWIDGHVAAGFFWGESPASENSAAGLKLRSLLTFGDHVYVTGEWRQNGATMGLEWRLQAGVRVEFGQRRSAPSSAPLHLAAARGMSKKAPVVAARGSKNPSPVGPAPHVDAPSQPLSPTLLPGGMFQPVQRTVWPFARGKDECECRESIEPTI